MSKLNYLYRRTLYDLTRPVFIKQMLWAALMWVIMTVTLLNNISFLKKAYPKPIRPPDLLHDLIPRNTTLIDLGDVCGIIGSICMIYIMWQWRFQPVPKLLFLLAAMYTLRAFAILLTPLAQIQIPAKNYPESNFIAQNFYYGMFFSGHTASAFIQVFLVKGHPLRPLVAVVATFQVFTLIASHSHYTIDVFGGFFVAYFFTHFDFMCLVPKPLLNVKWMPWYSDESPVLQMQHSS